MPLRSSSISRFSALSAQLPEFCFSVNVNHLLSIDDLKGIDMAAPKIAHAAYQGPSVLKEIFYGISMGLAAGFLWKIHHWNVQRKTKEFYELLDRGEISVVVEDE